MKVKDSCVWARLLEGMTDTSKNTVHRIMIEDLKKRKICAKIVPHSLNDDQNCVSVEHFKNMIAKADGNKNFLNSIVTGDETWWFHTDPSRSGKVQFGKNYHHRRQTKNKKQTKRKCGFRKLRNQDKSHHFLWSWWHHSQGFYSYRYYYYYKLLFGSVKASYSSSLQSSSLIPTRLLVFPNYAPTTTSITTQQFLTANGIEMFNHLPYSLDLFWWECFPFPNSELSLYLKGTIFNNILDIKESASDYLMHNAQTDF